MKKILLLIIVLSGMSVNAQLNSNAKLIQENLPEKYELIKLVASKDWEGDHEMMLYIINKQSDSYVAVIEFTKTPDYDKNLLDKAINDWSEIINGKNCIDWTMVEYSYKKQINAKGKY